MKILDLVEILRDVYRKEPEQKDFHSCDNPDHAVHGVQPHWHCTRYPCCPIPHKDELQALRCSLHDPFVSTSLDVLHAFVQDACGGTTP